MSIIGPLLAKPGTNGRDPCLGRFVELLMISYSFSQLLFVLREVFFFKGTNLWFWQRACDLEHGDLHLKCKELKLIWLLFPNNHCIFLYIHFAQFSTLLSFRLKNCNCISTNLSVLGMLRGFSCYSRKVSLKITTTQFSKGAKKSFRPRSKRSCALGSWKTGWTSHGPRLWFDIKNSIQMYFVAGSKDEKFQQKQRKELTGNLSRMFLRIWSRSPKKDFLLTFWGQPRWRTWEVCGAVGDA